MIVNIVTDDIRERGAFLNPIRSEKIENDVHDDEKAWPFPQAGRFRREVARRAEQAFEGLPTSYGPVQLRKEVRKWCQEQHRDECSRFKLPINFIQSFAFVQKDDGIHVIGVIVKNKDYEDWKALELHWLHREASRRHQEFKRKEEVKRRRNRLFQPHIGQKVDLNWRNPENHLPDGGEAVVMTMDNGDITIRTAEFQKDDRTFNATTYTSGKFTLKPEDIIAWARVPKIGG